MTETSIDIEVQPLKVKLKSTFRHAGAKRDRGSSIWVRAVRGQLAGYGEGCPRSYSAGDDLETSVQWVQSNFSTGRISFQGFTDVKQWVVDNEALIDRYPSAWCAIEMALLDLLARERGCSVEKLLGIKDPKRRGMYTAVLGDDKKWKYTTLLEQYLVRGFTDFKIKLSGDIQRDNEKITLLHALCAENGAVPPRIRLDANNLWAGSVEAAIDHLKNMDGSAFAIEEPVGPEDTDGMRRVSEGAGLPVILDESLCTSEDLLRFKDLPGKYIANVKVSRVGGIIRSLRLIDEVKRLGWPVIVGCHVGETSLLTRAALITADAAGEDLVAQEGAYGDYLVEREPVSPLLKFGRSGLLDLDLLYYYKTVHGLQLVAPENWQSGLGMQCRWPVEPDDGAPHMAAFETPDRYRVHYRLWGPETGSDVFVILHGGMSHSGWQAPLANAMRAVTDRVSIVAPDRRGCGMNTGRGDLGSMDAVIQDVVKQVASLKESFDRVHLAGWCQGAQYATVAAEQAGSLLTSLILLTPGFFWNERFRSVIRLAENNIIGMVKALRLQPDHDQAYVPIPMEPTDFTLDDAWLDFIEDDNLKTTMITKKSAHIMDEVQELSWGAILNNRLPLMTILANNDRLVDNRKIREFMAPMFPEGGRNKLVAVDSGHAVQFEMPEKIAGEIVRFIDTV